MPKLGLGINLTSNVSSTPVFSTLNLYRDSFIAYPNSGYSFLNRQFFSSGSSSTVTYGSGIYRQTIGSSGRHAIGYFDCNAEQYPTYDNGVGYSIGAVVYGGIYGHGLFRRTGNPGNPGYPPNFLFTPSGTQDASGWTRIHPVLRTIMADEELKVTFNLRLNSSGTGLVSVNAIRFGLFDSSTNTDPLTYVNADNLTVSNAIYGGTGTGPGYRGYMSGISSAASNNHRIHTRTTTTDPRLISTTSAVYTENVASAFSGFTSETTYLITLTIKRLPGSVSAPSGALLYTSSISGGSLSGSGTTLSWTDNSPSTYSFDTLCLYGGSFSCVSFDLSNVNVSFKNKIPRFNNFFNPLYRIAPESVIGVTGGSNVSYVEDTTSNSNRTLPLNGTVQAIENSLNGKRTLRFDGTSSLISPTVYPFNYNYPFTMIGVSKASGSNAIVDTCARYFLSASNQTAYDVGLSYGAYGNPTANFSGFIGKSYTGSSDIESFPMGENVAGLSVLVSDGTTVSHYLNGALIGTLPTSAWSSATLNSGRFTLGCEYTPNITTSSFFSRCDIAEVMFYNRAITTTERQQVETYLANKYAIQLPNINNMFLPQLWLKADAGVTLAGSNVTTWADQSGNNNNAIADTGEEPTFVSSFLNNKPAIRFNGNGKVMEIADSYTLDFFKTSVFIVLKYLGQGTGNNIVYIKNANAGSPEDPAMYGLVATLFGGNLSFPLNVNSWVDNPTNVDIKDSIPRIFSMTYGGSDILMYADGFEVGSGSIGGNISTSTGTLQIGGYNKSFSGAEYFNGDVAEIIMYNRAVTSTERQQVEAYLNTKYAIY
jgi:hypothetical protein